jgi:ribosomal protein S18 acetylase RimI-like enzyme
VQAGVPAAEIGAAVGEARERALECVYLLVEAEDADAVVAAEEAGFRMREIRTELQRPVSGHPVQTVGLKRGSVEDLEQLAPIARERFRGTRFFNDQHFERERSSELYVEWLRRGLTDERERQTLVAAENQGFVVCHCDADSGLGTIELIGVSEIAAGRGLGRTLMAGAGALFVRRSLTRAKVATQGSNLGAQRLYQACGYRTTETFLWLHLWLSDAGDF